MCISDRVAGLSVEIAGEAGTADAVRALLAREAGLPPEAVQVRAEADATRAASR
ncbi:MAG: hypothetical protein IRZ11_00005 [Clostridia bacterium]|nr:hypothetical protein [Clostridia bacterium]